MPQPDTTIEVRDFGPLTPAAVEPEEYETVAETLYNRSADLQNRLQEATAGGDTVVDV